MCILYQQELQSCWRVDVIHIKASWKVDGIVILRHGIKEISIFVVKTMVSACSGKRLHSKVQSDIALLLHFSGTIAKALSISTGRQG
jgi:hypothetical protein